MSDDVDVDGVHLEDRAGVVLIRGGAAVGPESNGLRRAVVREAAPISPSQVRPVDTHRLHAGLPSSHFTFRTLQGCQLLPIHVNEHIYLHVLQPFLVGWVTFRLLVCAVISHEEKCQHQR